MERPGAAGIVFDTPILWPKHPNTAALLNRNIASMMAVVALAFFVSKCTAVLQYDGSAETAPQQF
jgi:hypothetical protein